MRFVALLAIQDPEKNRAVRPEHLRYVEALWREGKVLEAGPFPDGWGGMVVYEAETEEQARAMAQADPAVTSGARTLVLHPYRPLSFPLSPEELSR